MIARDYVSQQRQEAYEFGRAHREALVSEWMSQTGETTRPLLRDIIEEVITDVLNARLRDEILPLDRFAQTERVNGRFEVSINSRIDEMPKVKNVAGIRYAAEWHETIHIVRDFPTEVAPGLAGQEQLPGFAVEPPELVVCRGFGDIDSRAERARESFAESAGTAAAICRDDLARCPEYGEFTLLISKGGALGKNGWRLVYRIADFIGVNGPLLSKFWQHQGFIRVGRDGTLLAQPSLGGARHD